MKSPYTNIRRALALRLRAHFTGKELTEQIAYAISQMLKTPLQHSRALAREGAARRAQLHKLVRAKNPSRALDTLRGLRVPLDVPEAVRELMTHGDGAYLLALPCTASALSLVAHLVGDERRRFCVVDTRLTRFYFHTFVTAPETRERVRLLSPAQMLAHNRARLAGGGDEGPVTYVTFPDLQTTSLDTARRVPFMGEDYQLSTLDPLLFFRGRAPLYTFGADDYAATRRLKLVPYHSTDLRAAGGGDVDALLTWLAARIELVFREAPADVLSWTETQMLAHGVKASTAVLKLKMVEGYVRAWKAADPDFKDATYARSLAELQKAQDAVDKERPAAAAG